MTSIDNNQNSNSVNLFDFLNGNRADIYTVPEEKGFLTTGNIGSLLNSNPNYLKTINNGILLNNRNLTNHAETQVINIVPENNDWTQVKTLQPQTPQLYNNEQSLSELLPYYPNGQPNVLLNPSSDMTLDGVAAPQLYGGTTAFVNNPNVVNNPNNNIGHELEPYGSAVNNGLRALSQGTNSCDRLAAGHNVPNLAIKRNNNKSYIASPVSYNKNIPLYQVGDWTKNVPNNFLQEFNNNVGQGCNN